MRSKASGNLAIVRKFESDGAAETFPGGAFVGDLVLLRAQRHPRHLAARRLGQIEAKAAPARADIQQALTRLDGELGCQVPLFGQLGLFQIGIGGEIGTGILPVAIQEEVVDGALNVVVVRHVAPRPTGGIELHGAPDQIAHNIECARPGRHRMLLGVLQQ